MHFTIRRATLDDLRAVCQFGLEVSLLHARARPDVFAASLDAGRIEPHWRRAIEADGRAAFIAETDTRAVGFITGAVAVEPSAFFLPSRICHVGTVGVAEAARGHGIGRALMAQLEQWGAQRGADEVQLTVWTFNERARKLYAELGYEERSVTMGKRVAPGRAGPGGGHRCRARRRHCTMKLPR